MKASSLILLPQVNSIKVRVSGVAYDIYDATFSHEALASGEYGGRRRRVWRGKVEE